jgi:hypothetical protein
MKLPDIAKDLSDFTVHQKVRVSAVGQSLFIAINKQSVGTSCMNARHLPVLSFRFLIHAPFLPADVNLKQVCPFNLHPYAVDWVAWICIQRRALIEKDQYLVVRLPSSVLGFKLSMLTFTLQPCPPCHLPLIYPGLASVGRACRQRCSERHRRLKLSSIRSGVALGECSHPGAFLLVLSCACV